MITQRLLVLWRASGYGSVVLMAARVSNEDGSEWYERKMKMVVVEVRLFMNGTKMGFGMGFLSEFGFGEVMC